MASKPSVGKKRTKKSLKGHLETADWICAGALCTGRGKYTLEGSDKSFDVIITANIEDHKAMIDTASS